jgi:hypothetical protein
MKTRAMLVLLGLCALLLALNGCATSRLDRHLAAQQRLETEIAALDTTARQLRASRDSLAIQNDSLRLNLSRLQADSLEREEQIRALRLELERLKEIDLKRARRVP